MWLVGSIIVSLRNKFHIPVSDTSISITIKPKSKERFYMAITLTDTSFAPASQFYLSTGLLLLVIRKLNHMMWCGL
jgi:predicted branched-subunit amino acid permease